MVNKKILISVIVFSILMFCTSIIKNKTRIVEKKIDKHERKISNIKNEIFETQLDFHYLSSPEQISERISFLKSDKYLHMHFSNIYLGYESFLIEQNKFSKK